MTDGEGKEKRLRTASRRIYNIVIRPRLPRKLGVVQGDIIVRRPGLFDATDREPDYEITESKAIRELTEPGDHVVVMGGGFGVTTVVAARAVGADGRVTVFEAVPEMADLVTEALELNDVTATVRLVRAAVAGVTDSSRASFGEAVETVAVDDMPAADVWSLDVEGAEDMILQRAAETGQLPDRVVCEVHEGRTDVDSVRATLGEHERRDRPVEADEWVAVRHGQ
jgi:hypothetical protein